MTDQEPRITCQLAATFEPPVLVNGKPVLSVVWDEEAEQVAGARLENLVYAVMVGDGNDAMVTTECRRIPVDAATMCCFQALSDVSDALRLHLPNADDDNEQLKVLSMRLDCVARALLYCVRSGNFTKNATIQVYQAAVPVCPDLQRYIQARNKVLEGMGTLQ